MNKNFQLGDILEFDGLPCVVVGLSGQTISGEEVPEEHVAVWFGAQNIKRKSGGGSGGVITEVWTIPEEYFEKSPDPKVSH